MKKAAIAILFSGALLAGCLARDAEQLSTPGPTTDLEAVVAAALTETQQSYRESLSPAPPYSPLELAGLLVPGDDLSDKWQPSTVYDLTQPYPSMPDFCGEYYGSCWPAFRDHIANSGAELELLNEGYQMGEVAVLYYDDPTALQAVYRAFQDNLSDGEENTDPGVNELWMHYYNHFQREQLGEDWLNAVGYSLYDWEGPEAENTSYRPERELLRVEIVFIRCQMLIRLDLRFPVENPWNSPEDNLGARAAEQETRFDQVYDYARALDTRVTPLACAH